MSKLFNLHSVEYQEIVEDFHRGLHGFTIGEIDLFFYRLGQFVTQVRSQLKYTENDSPEIMFPFRILKPDQPVAQEEYFISKLTECIAEITETSHGLLLPHPNDEHGELYSSSLLREIERLQHEIYTIKRKDNLLKQYSVDVLSNELKGLRLLDSKIEMVSHFIVDMRQNEAVGKYIPLEVLRAEELLHNLKHDQAAEIQKQIPLSLQDLYSLENRFNTLPMGEVIDFFSVLVTKKNKSGKTWMSESEFQIFIRRSFGKQDLKKPKINLGTGGIMAIVKRFWQFYNHCQQLDIQEDRSKGPFLELLKNAFDTDKFTGLRGDNFKVDKSTYDWGD